MLKLRRLVIHKHRIVKPGTTLVFHDGYNVLLGKNGTGKTTLLNLIAMCLSCSFAGLEEEEFSFEYELELPIGRLQIAVSHLLRRPPAGRKQPLERGYEVEIEIQFTTNNSKQRSFKAFLKNGRMSLFGAKEIVPSSMVNLFIPTGFLVSFLANFIALDEPENSELYDNTFIYLAGLLRLEFSECSRFDEGTEWLKDVLINATIRFIGPNMEAPATLHIYRIPQQLHHGVMKESVATGDVDSLKRTAEFSHEGLGFLKQAVNVLNYGGAVLTLELQSMERSRLPGAVDENEYTFSGLRLGFTKRSGQYLQLERLSFGEKRLVGFFYYLALNPSVLIADELANGLHHEMIERCLEAAGERQKFLATQNPLLLDHVPLQSAEDVRRTFIRCQLVSEGSREQMVWSGLSEDEAAAFYKDYEVGIQHTNDILRLRGLW